jgi:hypothetical protein
VGEPVGQQPQRASEQDNHEPDQPHGPRGRRAAHLVIEKEDQGGGGQDKPSEEYPVQDEIRLPGLGKDPDALRNQYQAVEVDAVSRERAQALDHLGHQIWLCDVRVGEHKARDTVWREDHSVPPQPRHKGDLEVVPILRAVGHRVERQMICIVPRLEPVARGQAHQPPSVQGLLELGGV